MKSFQIALLALLVLCNTPASADTTAPLLPQDAGPEAENESPQPEPATDSETDPEASLTDPISPEPTSAPPSTPINTDSGTVSDAEQISILTKAIADVEERLSQLKAEREDPQSEYAQAQAAFSKADSALNDHKKTRQELDPEDAKAQEAAQAELVRLEKARNLAKERFDLAIEDRKVSAEQLTTLEKKLLGDRKALDKLEGRTPPPEPATADANAPTIPPAPASATTPSPSTTPPAATPDPALAATPTTSTATSPALPPAPVDPQAAPPAAAANIATSVDPKREPSKELIEAQRDAETKAEASSEAEDEARSAIERLKSLDNDIALEQKLLVTSRKQRDNAAEIRGDLTAAFRERSLAGAPRTELDGLLAQVKKIEERYKAAGQEVQEHTARLEELFSERSIRQAQQLDALQKAAEAREEVKVAEKTIKKLENPFRLTNILYWLVDHGPRMLLVLFAMLAGHLISKLFSHRVIHFLAQNGARGSTIEREARARTLVGVFRSAASMAILVGGGLMLLQEAGIPIAPLVGGAAVFGLAVAFGAQNLIRDYFYGFVILLENQYKLNDVVKIGDLSGQVENITLRMTVLRDLEGRVHFLPNGQITAVTNMTHGWSRALFDIGIAYKENVDHVIAVLMTLCRDLKADPQFGPMILEDATMLGVDQMADSAIVIKFYIKTIPLQQWNVKRELLRRIKNRFDELGIEIPFPQRTVTHRVEPGVTLTESLGGPGRILHGLHAHRPISAETTDGPSRR